MAEPANDLTKNKTSSHGDNPFYKKWWFWVAVIAVFVLIYAISPKQSADTIPSGNEDATDTSVEVGESSGDSEQTQQQTIQDIYSSPENAVTYFAEKRISSMDGAKLLGVSVSKFERYEYLDTVIEVDFSRGSSLSVLGEVLSSYSTKLAEAVYNGLAGFDQDCQITISWKVTNPQHQDVQYKFSKSGNGVKLISDNYE